MTGALATFATANAAIARGIDRFISYPPRQTGDLGKYDLNLLFRSGRVVADVGGGKKPYAVSAGFGIEGKTYVGLDLDSNELALAPMGSYSEKRVLDICVPDPSLSGRFDLVICRNTLEHVRNTEAALAGLAAIMAPGGLCYLRIPCRRAVFAQLNLLLPNELKRRMMHTVFPHKAGDGFPAYYNRCLPSAINRLAEKQGLVAVA